MFKKNPLFGLALVLLLGFSLGTPKVKAQGIPLFAFENYTDCDIDVLIEINCGGGMAHLYQGSIGAGGTHWGTTGIVSLMPWSAPYDPARNPFCTIEITVRVGGQIYSVTGNTGTSFQMTYCCATPPPGGCSIGNNCTTLEWHPYGIISRPGC